MFLPTSKAPLRPAATSSVHRYSRYRTGWWLSLGTPTHCPQDTPSRFPPAQKHPDTLLTPQPAWTAPGSSCPIFGRVFGCRMLCSRLAPAASCSSGGSCFLGDPWGSLCPHPGDISTLLCRPSLWWGGVGVQPQGTSSSTTLSPPGETAGCLHEGFWLVKDTQSLKKNKMK